MPRRDRSGPMGLGPRTGRGAGNCAGFAMPEDANAVPGRGFGLGLGRGRGGWGGGGRGWRQRFCPTGLSGWLRSGWWGGPPYFAASTPAAEREYLEEVAESLQGQLDDIKKRLDELSVHDREKVE